MWGVAGIWSRAGQARLCQARPGQDRADGRTGLEGGQSGADYRIQVTKIRSHIGNGIASSMPRYWTSYAQKIGLQSELPLRVPIREFQI